MANKKNILDRRLNYPYRCPLTGMVRTDLTFAEAVYLQSFSKAKKGSRIALKSLREQGFTERDIKRVGDINKLREIFESRVTHPPATI